MSDEKKKQIFDIIKSCQEIMENQQNKELYDSGYLFDYININNKLKSNLQRAAEGNRKLVIGIIGAVKAGKSSFLNALLFDGEQYLPKAITPSTATLTKISYSDTPKAVIHFFDKDDWNQIERNVEIYEERLNEAYKDYCIQFENNKNERKNNERNKSDEARNNQVRKMFSRDEFEIKRFRVDYREERVLSAVELKKMASSKGTLKYLGEYVELKGDIISQLNDYIDANGKFTSIVKNVELMVDNKNLRGIEIIDTPGLCDPVVSRGQKTKEELHNCDVVFLLSSVCEFLPADTINLMINSLPSAGVDEVIVVGSRFDDGITDDKGGDFLETAKKTKIACEKTFTQNMENIKEYGHSNPIIAKIEKSNRLYISSMCYVLNKKLKNKIQFTEEEEKVYEQLKEYTGFENKYLETISGINEVKKELNSILERKEQIIAENDSKLIENAADNFCKVLYNVKTYVETNNIKLRNMSKDEVEEKSQRIKEALIMSRANISKLFEIAGMTCEKKLISTKSILSQVMENHISFKTDTETSENARTVRAGFLGLRKDTIYETIITKKASTSKVKLNIQNYGAECIKIVNDEFTNLFDKDGFIRQIKEIIMDAFKAGNTDYKQDDILNPVEKLLMKLTLPKIEVDVNKYIDMLNSRFIKGYAENDEIYELDSLQEDYLRRIKSEYDQKIIENGQTISNIMKEESQNFSSELEKKFSNDINKLLVQMEEQEKYINLNKEFAQRLEEYITKFKETKNAVV